MQDARSYGDDDAPRGPGRSAGWFAVIVLSTLAFSLVLACATPFAALAAFAATRMPARQAAFVILATWLANQVVGFGILGYPLAANSFAWGAAIGAAALLATAASAATRLRAPALATVVAFGLAFLVYEGALFAATALLSSGPEAFSLPIIARILGINLLALAGLMILDRLATGAGLPIEPRPQAALPSGT